MERAVLVEHDQVEVPSFFLCPISLQIMRDPVTLSTGITYDRHSIERWIFTDKHGTCPLTKQDVVPSGADGDVIITPNHTLRRLIQAWCSCNASKGVERFPTPRPPVSTAQILALIEEAATSSSDINSLPECLRKLRLIVTESERNKRCVESSGQAVDFLVSVIGSNADNTASGVLDEALHIFFTLQPSEQTLIQVIESNSSVNFIETLTAILNNQRSSNGQCRAYSILLLKSIVSVISSPQLIVGAGLKEELFVGIVRVLQDKVSYQATKAALQVLTVATSCSSWGRENRLKAIEARAVPVIIELMVGEIHERKATEMMLMVLARLSKCAEGRAEIVGHDAGMAVVGRKLVRVSVRASERAVRIVHNIAKFSPAPAVLKEMVEVGVVNRICLLMQADCGVKTKHRVEEVLRMHARVWRSSPCLASQLQSSYR